MSKKGKKTKPSDKSKKPPLKEESEPWINELKTLVINDENWHCNVIMIVETNSYNMEYITVFNSVFVKGQNKRPFVKIISNTSLAVAVLELTYNENISTASNGYKKLCHEAIKYCSTEGFALDTPIPILASIIKYYIYNLKLQNLEEARMIGEYLQKKEKLRKESLMAVQNIVTNAQLMQKPKSGPKGKSGASSKKPTSSKKSGKDQGQEKKFTEIRKRGEEILDYVSLQTDRPVDGPQLYIILNSFKQPELLLELLKMRVPLVSLVKLHDFCTPDGPDVCKMIREDENIKICDGFHLICKESIVKQRRFSNPEEGYKLNNALLNSFWEHFYKILNNNDNILLFKDTIFLKFYPKLYYKLPANNERRYSCDVYEMIQKSFYDQVCHLMYDIQDVQRQHENFINHLIDHDTTDKDRTDYDFNKMDLYTSSLDAIPPEIINVPLILDCILTQVEHLDNRKESTVSVPKSQSDPSNKSDTKPDDTHLLMKLGELDIKHDLLNKEETTEEDPKPLPNILINGDEIGIKIHWWDKNYNIKTITCNMLKCFWENVLSRHLPVYYEMSFTDLQDNNNLFYTLKDIGELTIRDKLCNLPCIFDESSIIVKNKAFVFCLDNDYDKDTDVFENSEVISEKYRCDDVESSKLIHYEDRLQGHYVGQTFDFHSFCFEEMSSDVLLQNLFNSFESFNCLDLLQDYFKSKLFLKFHHRKTCRKEQHLMGTLKTRTSLRDFYDYSIEEEFFWLNEAELLYDESLIKKESSNLQTALNRLQYLENRRAHIIKAICSETRLKMYNMSKDESTQPTSLPVVLSYTEELKLEDESFIQGEPAREDQGEYLQAFSIDLPNRVQFSEKRQDFIISMNSQLHIKKLSRLYKYEALLLQITIHNHTLYFYQPVDSKISTSFHLIHHSGMVFHFDKNEVSSIVDNLKKEKLGDQTKDTSNAVATTSIETPSYTEVTDIFLKPLIYQLRFSLPNSLCLEFINPNSISLYIKQYYLNRLSLPLELQEEKFRCYLTDGKLIKFMNNNTVVIYHPNSEIFKCEILQPTIPESDLEPERVPNGNKSANVKQRKTANKEEVKVPQPKKTSLEENFGVSIKSYDYTSATGKQISVNDGLITERENLFSLSTYDIFNGVIVTKRSDGTVLTFNEEGTLFVNFPDGSRVTTTAYFSPDEINFDTGEALEETNEHNLEEASNTNVGVISEHGSIWMNQELDEIGFEEDNLDYSVRKKSEGFLVINIQHYFEHLNFASVLVDLNTEEVNINLPNNVDISLSSEGLYRINFNREAEFVTEYDSLIFREINNNNLPEFTLHLTGEPDINTDKQHDNSINNNKDTVTDKTKQDSTKIESKQDNVVKEKNVGEKGKIGKKDNATNNVVQSDATIKNEQDNIKGNNVTENNITDNTVATNDLQTSRYYLSILSCKDDYGNTLAVNSIGDVAVSTCNGFDNICKCNTINNCRQFIFNSEYNGLEVFPPEFLESSEDDGKKVENCVTQCYGSVDHQVLLLLKPLVQNENEKWLMPPKKVRYFPLYMLPSTYNDETTFFNPFPKKRQKLQPPPPKVIPSALLIRVINRVNCNVHLEEEIFLQNKSVADFIRLNKSPELALQLFERGNIPFCKADKEFIDYIKGSIIESMIARVRRRVVKRLEMRMIREYTNILVNRLLLPYFDSATGAVHVILLDILLSVIQMCTDDRNKLEKLFCKPLKHLTDEDLEYMHDRIAPLTIARFCNCDENEDFCQLRILLLAGTTLDGIFPNMISVFHSFGSNLKKKKEAERKRIELKELLNNLLFKQSDTLTEDDLKILHDELRKLKNIPFCSCRVSIVHCKLKAILLATVVLSYIFPNVDSIFKSYKINIEL